ncbi:sugar transferase [Weissella confusa]
MKQKVYFFGKRIIDFFGGIVAIIIFFPTSLFIALSIKIEDGGKIFFKQKRVGQNGKIFYMWKFRSMVEDAETLKGDLIKNQSANETTFKMKDDPRVTNVGKFIRKRSLDEIPQFINVLKGEMSLVGPRPGLPEEYAEYSQEDAGRLMVPPGLTGLWQVSGRSNLTYSQMIELDLEYVRRCSLWLDIKILIATVIQMFAVENNGAY